MAENTELKAFADATENLKNTLIKKEKYDKLPKDLAKVKKYILERT